MIFKKYFNVDWHLLAAAAEGRQMVTTCRYHDSNFTQVHLNGTHCKVVGSNSAKVALLEGNWVRKKGGANGMRWRQRSLTSVLLLNSYHLQCLQSSWVQGSKGKGYVPLNSLQIHNKDQSSIHTVPRPEGKLPGNFLMAGTA